MHICHITFTQIPSRRAHSVQVMKVCQALARGGHQVTLLIPDAKGICDGNLKAVWHHYGIREPFDMQTLPAPIPAYSYFSFPRILTAHSFALQSVRRVQEIGADIVFTRHLPTAALASLKNIPTVFELHSVHFGITGRAYGLYMTLMRRGKGFRRFVVITEALKSILQEQYPRVFHDAEIVLAPGGVDLERFRDLPDPETAQRRLGLEIESSLIAGYAGSFIPGKGVELIYELARQCPQVGFLVMGGDPEGIAQYEQRAQRDGIRNLILAGFVANTDLPSYLAACDVLLLPNQRPKVATYLGDDPFRWTSPLKLFEYMAVGRAIIASDLPVLREVLNEGNALLCPPGDVASWRQALQVCANENIRQTLASQAKREAVRHEWGARVALCLEGLT